MTKPTPPWLRHDGGSVHPQVVIDGDMDDGDDDTEDDDTDDVTDDYHDDTDGDNNDEAV